MVLATAAVAAAAGGSLFGYNRKNFLYDRKMRQETEYQIMDFRIKQAQLWREDVKDIIGLTSVKMDTYLIVNAVQLGFCVMAFCEGRLEGGSPVWLIGCHTLSLSGAFMYLLMSVWLSMHASVTAKSYEVRLLTQLVRLPVPSWAQLEGARTYSSGFEKTEPKQMFRVPFAMGTQEKRLQGAEQSRGGGGGDGDGASQEESGASADLWGLERRGDRIYELDGTLRTDPMKLRHLRLVREAMQYWQAYDGFARVAMSVGTNQLVAALSYYVVGYVLISNHAVIASWLVVMLFMVVASALIRLDMSLTGLDYRISVLLIVSGPCLTAVAVEEWSRETQIGEKVANILAPIAYLTNMLWLAFLLHISKVREQRSGAMLPTGFRSVMYVDVFGWVRQTTQPPEADGADGAASPGGAATPRASGNVTKVPGSGPAVQAVRYADGQPVPSRPEELPGAAQSPFALEGLRKEDFEPTTFVPREKDGEQASTMEKPAAHSHWRPGFVPWRLFCAATVLLIVLWGLSGIFVLITSLGGRILQVAPAEHAHHSEAASLLEVSTLSKRLPGGEKVATAWPDAHVRPLALACSELGKGTLVAASQFQVFVAQLGETVNFTAAPWCEGISGESLQDVTMRCNGKGPCSALVLHRQGELVSQCPMTEEKEAPGPTLRLSDEWLGDGNLLEHVPQEEVSSMSLAERCSGSAEESCAYVQTSGRRIVELRMNEQAKAEQQWFPTRILEAGEEGADILQATGALRLLSNGRYIGVLQAGQQLKVIDPQDGAVLGEWHLPQDRRWRSMCNLGSDLYLLAEGSELWRFPLPNLQSGGDVPAVASPPAANTTRRHLKARAFLQRRPQVTLDADGHRGGEATI